MKTPRYLYNVVLLCALLLVLVFAVYRLYHTPLINATLGAHPLHLYVADTPVTRMKGLGGRDVLPEDYGMLFIFDHAERYPFWMKGMLFPIDIIWLNNDKKVIDISPNVQPQSYPNTIVPRSPARYVVEVSAGWITRHSLHIGDILQ